MKFDRPIILASTSPRRKFLMDEAGFQFRVEKPEADETFPPAMAVESVPKFLAEKKATSFKSKITNEIVITADTVVILENKILNKPSHREEAIQMLSELSGRTHLVITAVSLLAKEKEELFDHRTEVTFKQLRDDEISYYVDTYKPFDKAGAYGAQEFLPVGINPCCQKEIEFLKRINNIALIEKSITKREGLGIVGIEKIKGSYFNVMGLPIHVLYDRLKKI